MEQMVWHPAQQQQRFCEPMGTTMDMWTAAQNSWSWSNGPRRSRSESSCSNSQSPGPKKWGCGGLWRSVLIQTLVTVQHWALQQTFWNLKCACFFNAAVSLRRLLPLGRQHEVECVVSHFVRPLFLHFRCTKITDAWSHVCLLCGYQGSNSSYHDFTSSSYWIDHFPSPYIFQK